MTGRSHEDATRANRSVMTEFARLMYDVRDPVRAFDEFVSPEYIQHNPALPDGRDAAVAFLAPLYGAAESRFELLRMIVDGDLVALHVRAHPVGRPLLAVTDIYRLADGLIVEHWDVIQPVPEASANPHPMF